MPLGFETPHLAVLTLCAAACAFDIRTRHIPNSLTLGGAALAIAYGAAGGSDGLLTSALGWLSGLLLFLPFFVLGGMGAGDVKLLACLGAWLGPESALWLALYAAMAGGVMALIVAVATGYLRQAISNIGLLLIHWHTFGLRALPQLTLGESRGPRLPYAVPMAAAVAMLFWLPRF